MSFRKDFMWGVATAAYQIEGAVEEDGRGPSVWDVFCREPGKIANGQTGDIACDHYHRLDEDVQLMKQLGVNTYRFSISWTRILPGGIGAVNLQGIAFYNRLIDRLLENGIQPCLTLFHWDYPYALEKQGGWLNSESPHWFAEYARTVFHAFGNRVKLFFTFNEPQCFIGAAYAHGKHAPGHIYGNRELVLMAHHVMKAHGLAIQAFRELVPDGRIGYAPTGSGAIPFTDSAADVEAARQRYFDIDMTNWTWNVSWWSDPVLLGRYPEETEAFAQLREYLPSSWKEDLTLISTPIDIYGQNLYNGALYKAADKDGESYEWVPNPMETPKTGANWPVTPRVFYWAPKFLYERYHKPVMITENGMSCHDAVSLDGHVHDPNRIDFTHRYLRELKRAAADGVDILGYMHWTLMDNFEWALGYTQRFGLIYVDFETQRRIPKDSFGWYRRVIQSNGEEL